MRSHGSLFIATALLECGAGLALLGSPALATWLVLGVRTPSPEALFLGRIGGAGLLAIGVACWFARADRGSRAQQGLLRALLVYNAGACAALVLAGSASPTPGVALWPGVGLHVVMTIWCVLSLRGAPAARGANPLEITLRAVERDEQQHEPVAQDDGCDGRGEHGDFDRPAGSGCAVDPARCDEQVYRRSDQQHDR